MARHSTLMARPLTALALGAWTLAAAFGADSPAWAQESAQAPTAADPQATPADPLENWLAQADEEASAPGAEPAAAPAAEAPADAAMESRLASLERRLEELETALAPLIEEARAKRAAADAIAKAREAARRRMRADLDIYSRAEVEEIEGLYQVANTNWRSDKARESLDRLVTLYKRGNRVGCGLLYLGQLVEGEQGEEYLRRAIEEHSDSYYGDGVQVGPYARYVLAMKLIEQDKQAEADRLLDEVRLLYPDAIDHQGNLLVSALPKD